MPVTLPPTDLPVEDTVDALRDALAGGGTAVLQAPPGAGKTTIVPLRLLDEPWLAGQKIVVLEPRRVAARAAARRMAAMIGDQPGGLVGWRTRTDHNVSDRTRIEVVTEGILTRRLQTDPSLPGTGLVVFDEFHERNLQGDLGLALALEARGTIRPDLRLLVMSATLDGQPVAELLGGVESPAPVIESHGRTYPVDVRWLPRRERDRLEPAVTAAVGIALREVAGGLLVFLPGAGEIHRVERLLAEGALPDDVDVYPLHGSLPVDEQDRALAPGPAGRRKVVLATDLAESSLTVDGVVGVVDSGLARAPRFDTRTGMTRLTTIPISRASADQRAGRAGRTAPGIAWRLWSKVEHAARRPHIEAEITQVDLTELALELASWGADAAALPFLDPPPQRALTEARSLLTMLGALDGDRITDEGRAILSLPLHPRLAHMVHASAATPNAWLACSIAALLDDRDVLRGRPDDVPADLDVRLGLLNDPARQHPAADGRSLRSARERARDIARRAGIDPEPPGLMDASAAGRVLAVAYPDRVGQRRGGPGRFRLRTGSGAWVRPTDALANESFVVAADLDGRRGDARIRIGAALGADDVIELFGHDVVEHATLTWDRDRDDLVARVDRQLDSLQLGVVEQRAEPGPLTTDALLQRVRATKLAVLRWTDEARSVQQRVAFLRTTFGDSWPDLSDAALLRSLDEWVEPFLVNARGRAELEQLDVAMALRTLLPFDEQLALDDLAPPSLTLPNGRDAKVDYADGQPSVAARVQAFYGSTVTPTVAGGRVTVVLELLSPADRPIQVTSDLAGFWTGSWREVRKDMAGRYPKHDWPENPAT